MTASTWRIVLDIGPGYGDALDVAHEQGARACDFIEIDPFFYTHNRLKKLGRAYQLSHLTGMAPLERGRYDLIWLKGSLASDWFVSGIRSAFLNLNHWLRSVEHLASAASTIVICPHWRHESGSRVIKDVLNNGFTEVMIARGFKTLQNVENHHSEPEYPITYVKCQGTSNLQTLNDGAKMAKSSDAVPPGLLVAEGRHGDRHDDTIPSIQRYSIAIWP